MKFYYYFFTVKMLCLIFTITYTMEKNNDNSMPANILYRGYFPKRGAIIKGAFSSKNNDIILTSLQFCWVYNNFSSKKIKNIVSYKSDEPIRHIIINHHNNLIAAQQLSLEISDITTKKKVWQKNIPPQESIIGFSPTQKNIFYTRQFNKIIENNFIENTKKELLMQPALFLHQPHITPHTTKDMFFLWKKSPLPTIILKSFCVKKENCTENAYTFPKKKNIYINECIHIKDDYVAIIENNNTISIIDIKNQICKSLPITINQNNNLQAEHSILTLPFTFLMAILKEDKITFWHTKTQKLVHSISLRKTLRGLPRHNDRNIKLYFKLLSFCSERRELLISFDETCFVLKVPLNALYEPNTANSCIFAFFILNSFLYDTTNNVPFDINRTIVNYFHALSKY